MAAAGSVKALMDNVQELRHQKTMYLQKISTANDRMRILQRRTNEVAQNLGISKNGLASQESALQAVKARLAAKEKSFAALKSDTNEAQVSVKDCAARARSEADIRFDTVGKFEVEMMNLADMMSSHSVSCSLNRLENRQKNLDREEDNLKQEIKEAMVISNKFMSLLPKNPEINWEVLTIQCNELTAKVSEIDLSSSKETGHIVKEVALS